jgi:hypothetical protein
MITEIKGNIQSAYDLLDKAHERAVKFLPEDLHYAEEIRLAKLAIFRLLEK